MENQISFFDRLVIRIPRIPFQQPSDENLKEVIANNQHFLKALFAANPHVHQKAIEWFQGKLKDEKKIEKIKETLVNYYTRMYSNPAPFGLFSSVGCLEWTSGGKNRLELKNQKAKARIDMEALNKLLIYLNAHPFIKSNIAYFTNNTTYQLGNQIRYTEDFIESGKLSYKLSGVEYSDILSEILAFSKTGKRKDDIIDSFTNEYYSKEDIGNYIDELIEAQLLISELQLNITGKDPLKNVISIIKNISAENNSLLEIVSFLTKIDHLLNLLSDTDGGFVDVFNELNEMFTSIGIQVDPKNLVQLDLFSSSNESFIDDTLQIDLYNAIKVLSYFNQKSYLPKLEGFKKNFLKKYESTEVPLLSAIDAESGISFGDFSFETENILLKNFHIALQEEVSIVKTKQGESARKILYRKVCEAWRNNQYTVHLGPTDFDEYKDKIADSAATGQVIFSIIDVEQRLMNLSTAGNASAGNLISRFAYGSEDIEALLHDIADYENDFFSGSVVAEVVHIPEHRMGNVSFRPILRKYEIPVMTRSLLAEDFQIPLSDLHVTVMYNKIILFSKKMNKRVIPYVTNAHNYGKNTSPIYQFLGELQYQDIVPSFAIDKGDLDMSQFLPRIQVKNVIISKATWKFTKANISSLYADLSNESILKFRQKWNLPERTSYFSNGGYVLIDWTCKLSISNFLKQTKEMDEVVMQEFLFNPNSSFVADESGRAYFSECIATYKNLKRDKLTWGFEINEKFKPAVKRKFHLNEEWLYIKIYCGVNVGDKILKHILPNTINSLFEKKSIKKFFFLPFNDPDYHLRIRFELASDNTHEVISILQNDITTFLKDDLVWKFQTDTYNRELQRYGYDRIHLSEKMFDLDSRFVLGLVNSCTDEYKYFMPLIVIRNIDSILNGFSYSIQDKLTLLETMKKSYETEFKIDTNKVLHKAIDSKELENRKIVGQIMTNDFETLGTVIDENTYFNLLTQYEKDIQALFHSEDNFNKDVSLVKYIITSLIHMHSIRCFPTKPRDNELLVYSILHAYYRKEFHKQKVSK